MQHYKSHSCLVRRQRSQSVKNLHEQLYGTLPRSMRSEVLVKAREEEPNAELETR